MSDSYNATLTKRTDFVDGLAIFRIAPDFAPVTFEAGQYATLGLLESAPRVPEADPDPPGVKPGKIIKRAYSIGSSCKVTDHLEFYLVLVPEGALSPRLFAMNEGDRIWMARRCMGTFTLTPVPDDRDLVLVSTGTGIAPYISMVRAYFKPNEGRRWAVVHGVRKSQDLSYHDELNELMRSSDNFFYLPAITRPDGDPWSGLVGRVNKILEEGTFEKEWGRSFDSTTQHVYLCGNPGMIESATDWLGKRGFSKWNRNKNLNGNIHLEKYW